MLRFLTEKQLLWVLAGVFVAHALWIVAGTPLLDKLPALGNLNSLPVWGVAALLCFRASGRYGPRLASVWRWIGSGALAWFAAQVLYTLLALLKLPVFPSVADAAYLLVIPFIAVGVLLLRRDAQGPLQTASFVLDVLLVVLTLGDTLWQLYLREVAASYATQPLAGAIALGYPLMDLLLSGLLVMLLLWRPRELSVAQLTALMLGGVSYLGADLVYAYQVAQDTYHTGTWMDIAWNGFALSLGLAASWGQQPRSTARRLQPSRARAIALLPQLTGSAVLAVYAIWWDAVPGTFWMPLVLGPLFLLRQALGLLDTQRLTRLLTQQAERDFLTGLLNRVQLEGRLQDAIEHAVQHRSTAALLFMDLDRLKLINDTYGHPAGDTVLREVAARLSAVVAERGTLARFGGDEFVLMLPDLDAGPELERLTERLLSEVNQPIRVGSEQLSVSLSIGVALCPADATTPTEAIAGADAAMYRAKNVGKGTWRYTDESLNERLQADLQMETLLRGALARGEFVLHYQPLVRLDDGALMGFEALLRWNSPQLGWVPPCTFIPMAEERGMIAAIGRWVLAQAADQVARWRESQWPQLYVSVNVAASQFEDEHFASDVAELLTKRQLPGSALELELTERSLISAVTSSAAQLRALRRLGIRIALDDFGTGYSSLSALQELPVDVLKIDRSFIKQVDSRGHAFIQAMVTLAQSLNILVIIEGIETQHHMDTVGHLGCQLGQGYFFAPPQVAAQAQTYRWTKTV
ncbi:EAL domain-containing protein [Deinococcus sp. Arct2-2]|uniref:putative bifunctional diguanylate cyclase/phosphodiesterase n=1 Tax=Deinococcus sp. Arct2-2 TaxID=2568653 RepID=UPI0010A2FF26|nr:EAL domain-containing protein [Deinococcus sp. Arct2-2]THF69733.1 EAL domain-containing protein [Deinococcus sp. Arct2-2]